MRDKFEKDVCGLLTTITIQLLCILIVLAFCGCSTPEPHVYQEKGHWMVLHNNGSIQHHPGCHCGEDL